MSTFIPPVQTLQAQIATIEQECSNIRQWLIINNQYETVFPNSTTYFMPARTQAWLEYQLEQLISQENTLINGQSPPA
jgi:hypothetical protein